MYAVAYIELLYKRQGFGSTKPFIRRDVYCPGVNFGIEEDMF